MSFRGHHRNDAKSMSFRRQNNRFMVLVNEDSNMGSNETDDSPKSSGCLPRMFTKNRRNQPSGSQHFRSSSSASQPGGRKFLERLGIPFRGSRGGRFQVDNRKQVQMYKGQGGNANGPAINMIKILKGRMFGKEFILRSLSDYVEGDLKPILFKYNDIGDAIFYIIDNDMAAAVRSANNRITDQKTNSKLSIVTSKVAPIWEPLQKDEFQLVKTILGKRYNGENRALDLNAFGIDPVFHDIGFHASLQRNCVMMAVVELIDQYCGQVRTIDLSNNRLRYLDYLANLVPRAKSVSALNLTNNQIEHPSELDKLRGWNLTELNLEGNPICNKISDVASYKSEHRKAAIQPVCHRPLLAFPFDKLFNNPVVSFSAVHKVFPKVTLLDGVQIQSEMGFAIEDTGRSVEKSMPIPKAGFYVTDTLRGLIESFVVEYFGQYDGPDPEVSRKSLMAAYDDQALFTLSIQSFGEGQSAARYSDNALFKEYRLDSHNLLLMDRWERYRSKIIQKGSLNVVARLCRLPKTQHLLDSFLVDVSFANERLVCFTVQGLFRDGNNAFTQSTDVSFFARNFLVIPRGEGKIAVVNEQLYISAMTEDHAKQYFIQLNKANQLPSLTAFDFKSTPSVSSADSKNVKIARFIQESKLKPDWAEKCLADNEWNFEKAATVFLQLKQMDKLPSEAFQ